MSIHGHSHDRAQHKCSYCDYTGTTTYNLKAHKARRHGVSFPGGVFSAQLEAYHARQAKRKAKASGFGWEEGQDQKRPKAASMDPVAEQGQKQTQPPTTASSSLSSPTELPAAKKPNSSKLTTLIHDQFCTPPTPLLRPQLGQSIPPLLLPSSRHGLKNNLFSKPTPPAVPMSPTSTMLSKSEDYLNASSSSK